MIRCAKCAESNAVIGVNGEQLDEAKKQALQSKKRSSIEWEYDDSGYPYLPEVEHECYQNLKSKKKLIAEFLWECYGRGHTMLFDSTDADCAPVAATELKTAWVPWVSLNACPSDYIPRECLPPNVDLQELSHMKQHEVEALLNHWLERQESDPTVPVVRFIAYRDGEGNAVPITRMVRLANLWISRGGRRKQKTKELPGKRNSRRASRDKGKGKKRDDDETTTEDEWPGEDEMEEEDDNPGDEEEEEENPGDGDEDEQEERPEGNAGQPLPSMLAPVDEHGQGEFEDDKEWRGIEGSLDEGYINAPQEAGTSKRARSPSTSSQQSGDSPAVSQTAGRPLSKALKTNSGLRQARPFGKGKDKSRLMPALKHRVPPASTRGVVKDATTVSGPSKQLTERPKPKRLLPSVPRKERRIGFPMHLVISKSKGRVPSGTGPDEADKSGDNSAVVPSANPSAQASGSGTRMDLEGAPSEDSPANVPDNYKARQQFLCTLSTYAAYARLLQSMEKLVSGYPIPKYSSLTAVMFSRRVAVLTPAGQLNGQSGHTRRHIARSACTQIPRDLGFSSGGSQSSNPSLRFSHWGEMSLSFTHWGLASCFVTLSSPKA